jgi:hypothetical protein
LQDRSQGEIELDDGEKEIKQSKTKGARKKDYHDHSFLFIWFFSFIRVVLNKLAQI